MFKRRRALEEQEPSKLVIGGCGTWRGYNLSRSGEDHTRNEDGHELQHKVRMFMFDRREQ
jgi:hypothetical protein